MPARPAELLLALLRITGTYSVEPKSVGILSSCFVMYPVIGKSKDACELFGRFELDARRLTLAVGAFPDVDAACGRSHAIAES